MVPFHSLSFLSPRPLALAILLATSVSACGRSSGQPQAPPQGPPPAGVSIVTLESKAIPQSSDFIATVRSLRSTTVQPEGEGIVTKIFVKAGDRVRAGAPLVQINADRQQAAVNSAEANRVGTEADVEYWRQQAKRFESLLGTVGEIPIRVGDRVTTSTVITTIDDSSGLEAYIQVPLDRSPDLRLGLPVQLLDGTGKVVATNPVTFVAPRVDDATQTVLVKSALQLMPPSVRVQQFVRARIVWRTVHGLTVPVTAVTRISGQYFCFVAEPGPQGGLVARQKPLQVGELIGNDYTVTSGVKAGDRLIVSGIQKLGDGAPVQAQ